MELTVDQALAADAVERYGTMVLRIAFQCTGNQADAEDTAQEVFLVLLGEAAFQDHDHLKHWLIRVTIHRCENLRRAAWRRRTVPLTEAWPVLAPEEQRIMEELWLLKPKDRDVIYLYYYEGYKLHEISDLLGENANTIAARQGRARKKLKVFLAEDTCHEQGLS